MDWAVTEIRVTSEVMCPVPIFVSYILSFFRFAPSLWLTIATLSGIEAVGELCPHYFIFRGRLGSEGVVASQWCCLLDFELWCLLTQKSLIMRLAHVLRKDLN